jgi:hypothetical protein
MASGNTLAVWTPQAVEIPASSGGQPDVRNGHPVFDLATGESGIFSAVLPRHYAGGGLTVYVHYAMSSAIANNVKWTVAVERVGDGQQDIDADGFASGQSTGDVTVPGTSGHVDIASIAFTDGAQMDSLAVGEGFRLKVTRDTPSGTDATGDAELRFVEVKET